jgi:hypothetical protein
MLETAHFTRTGGGEEIGSERLEDWTPKTYGDIWSFHRAAMSRLADIGTGNDEFARRARSLLGSHIRGLCDRQDQGRLRLAWLHIHACQWT